jgi:hypothetical protein
VDSGPLSYLPGRRSRAAEHFGSRGVERPVLAEMGRLSAVCRQLREGVAEEPAQLVSLLWLELDLSGSARDGPDQTLPRTRPYGMQAVPLEVVELRDTPLGPAHERDPTPDATCADTAAPGSSAGRFLRVGATREPELSASGCFGGSTVEVMPATPARIGPQSSSVRGP